MSQERCFRIDFVLETIDISLSHVQAALVIGIMKAKTFRMKWGCAEG